MQIKEWEKEKKHKGGKMSGGTVAALAIGGAVGVAAVGVALYAFGDVGATMSGLMSGDAMSALGNIGGDIGNFLGGVGEGIADGAAAACDFCGDACGGVCGGVGDFCGDACGNIGDICGGLVRALRVDAMALNSIRSSWEAPCQCRGWQLGCDGCCARAKSTVRGRAVRGFVIPRPLISTRLALCFAV